jgi:hypothetical protein
MISDRWCLAWLDSAYVDACENSRPCRSARRTFLSSSLTSTVGRSSLILRPIWVKLAYYQGVIHADSPALVLLSQNKLRTERLGLIEVAVVFVLADLVDVDETSFTNNVFDTRPH